MGYTPDEIRAMSYAEYVLIASGFSELKRREAGKSEPEMPPAWEEIEEAKAACPDIAPAPGAELLPEFRPGWDGKTL